MWRIFAFSLLSSFAMTQYSGNIVDLNTIYDPPSNIISIICDDFDGLDYKACIKGVAGSDIMAKKYAQGAGSYLGCIDGYSQGVDLGYKSSKDPSSELVEEAKRKYSKIELSSAIDRAHTKAESEGFEFAADQIIKRFRDIVGTDRKPDESYDFPEINYVGEKDGYDYDKMGGDFGPVYQEDWNINSNSEISERVSARAIYRLSQKPSYDSTSLCDNTSTIFGKRKFAQLTLWDFYRARGILAFEDYGWRNSQWALEFFLNREKNLQAYIDYVKIADWTEKQNVEVVIGTQRVPVIDPSTGEQKVDENGKLIFEEKKITEIQEVDRKISAQRTSSLKKRYEESFKIAYDRYFAKKYASLSYHKRGLETYKAGLIVGTAIGEIVSKDIAEYRAYTEAYQLQSATAYALRIKENYKEKFEEIWEIFENGPVIELNSVLIKGENQSDGIFRLEEKISMGIDVTNLGRKDGSVSTAFLRNKFLEPYNSYTFSVKNSSQKSQSAFGDIPSLAKITRSNGLNNFIPVTASLNGSSVHTDLVEGQISKNIRINDFVEIRNVSPRNDDQEILGGNASIGIRIHNPAKVKTPSDVIRVSISALGRTEEIEGLGLGAGESRNFTLVLKDLDRLTIFKNEGFSGEVKTYMSGSLIDSKIFTYKVGGIDQNIASIFNSIAHSSNANSNEFKEVNQRIREEVKRLIRSNLKWHKNKHISGTIIEQIQDEYKNSDSIGTLSSKAKKLYGSLGEQLSEMVLDVKWTLFGWNKRRKGFVRQLKVFSPNLDWKTVKRKAKRSK